MGERLVIVIEYEVGPNMLQALTDAMTQIRKGVDDQVHGNAKAVRIHAAIKDDAARVLAVFAKTEATG